jgi:hypothetical protein
MPRSHSPFASSTGEQGRKFVRAFLNDLVSTGRVRIRPDDSTDDAELREQLTSIDAAARLELPFDPPPLELTAACWAAELLYQACMMLLLREVEPEVVRSVLAAPCPQPPSPSVCYSVDLILRYLPGLMALAKGLASDDPLVTALTDIARAWPLSSVGAGDFDNLDVSPFIDHPSLRQLYVDRIIAHNDASRLAHPDIRESVRASLGAALSPTPQFRTLLFQEITH